MIPTTSQSLEEYRSAQQRHANNRARERLGVKFNRHIAHEFIVQIKANKLKREAVGPGPGSWYKVEIGGRPAWIFYNRETDRIVTVLNYEPWQVYLPRRRQQQAEAARAHAAREIRENESREKMYRKQMRLTNWIFSQLLDSTEVEMDLFNAAPWEGR